MSAERRFRGAMSVEYRLVRLAIPQFEEVQRQVAEAVAGHAPGDLNAALHVLDLGCGDGVTSATILARRHDAFVTALDNEKEMIDRATDRLRQPIQDGRCQMVLGDALEYLRGQSADTLDVVASAFALHNLHRDYRRFVHQAIYRALRPGGLFVNGDKYALNDEQRFAGLHVSLERFFDLLVPLGKIELLRECVLHNVADEAPERVMREQEVQHELTDIGFREVTIRCRHDAAALLVAHKPSADTGPDA